ncbi:alpha/beta fold hydrolase [Patescibacteria group bacterium]|nr:alpha/beta fold hydrolase [Patescibacteria group bacterium]MBU1868093.1 alpha/beta fold hydrolase [Patescibacteria group bacterium]
MGQGPPLVILPATYSKLDNWLGLAQFMAQKFTIYFFELPGHGQSVLLAKNYSSQLIARSVDHFLDSQGIAKSNLMGFSFGGVLAVRVLEHLPQRIDKVILVSPLFDSRALKNPWVKQVITKCLVRLGQHAPMQNVLHRAFLSEYSRKLVLRALKGMVRVENADLLEEEVSRIPSHTLKVLLEQADDIFHTFPLEILPKLPHRCYFAMSVNDPLIDYQLTVARVREIFSSVYVKEFDFPYHQPRESLSLKYLNQHYRDLLDVITEG